MHKMPGEGTRTVRILVVEDEAKVARALKEGLEREQYKVTVARTGARERSIQTLAKRTARSCRRASLDPTP